AIPSLENGLWKLFPDGRMETTWTLREGARWHDGTPVTTDDLTFNLEVGQDRQLAAFANQIYSSIAEVTARDARTLTITWKEPAIEADGLFTALQGALLPKHLLEEAYGTDKASFLDLPSWTKA